MAYDFPSSPTNGQTYTPAGGQTYTWDAAGSKWTVTGTGLTGLSGISYRNMCINGDFIVDQRNGGTAPVITGPALNTATLDRWIVNLGQAPGAIVCWRQSITSTSGLIGDCQMVVAPTTADASLAVTDYYRIMHRIEGVNFRGAYWGSSIAKPITVSFECVASAGGPFTLPISFGNAADNRRYTTTFTATSAGGRQAIVIPGDVTGTWDYAYGAVGMEMTIVLGAGTNYNNAALNTWGTSSIGASGASNFMASTSNLLYFRDFQIEIGSGSTPFERISFEDQLGRCKRYYQEIGGSPNSFFVGGYGAAGATVYHTMPFPVEMARSPTIAKTGTWTTVNCAQPTGGAGLSKKSFTASTVVTALGTYSYNPVVAADVFTLIAEI